MTKYWIKLNSFHKRRLLKIVTALNAKYIERYIQNVCKLVKRYLRGISKRQDKQILYSK